MKWFAKNILILTVKIILLFRIDLLVNRNKVLVLMYHGVSAENIPRGSVENYDGKHVYAAKFEQQLRYLVERYDLISLEYFCDCIAGKMKLPRHPVLITFDDGYENNHDTAFPLLKKYDVSATVFVCPGLVGKRVSNWPDTVEYIICNTLKQSLDIDINNEQLTFPTNEGTTKIAAIIALKKKLQALTSKQRNKIIEQLWRRSGVYKNFSGNYALMDWQQIKQLNGEGISIGSHSMTHPIFTSESLEVVRNELVASKQIIEQNIGSSVRAFAYPNGVLDERSKQEVKRAGYDCAFAVCWGKNTNTSQTDRFALKRVPVTNNQDVYIFLANLMVNLNAVLFLLRRLLK